MPTTALHLSEGDEHKIGVAVYINEQLNAEELKIVSNYQESVWIKLKLKGNDELLVGCIYKSPNSDKENLSLLNKMIIEASQMKQFSHLLIMGDFNYQSKQTQLPTIGRTDNSGNL